MDGYILADFKEYLYAVLLFGLLAGIVNLIITRIIEAPERKTQKFINSLEIHIMKEENEEIELSEYNLEENNLAFM